VKKVLIVEDEPSIASLQRDYLEINGFETHIVADGEAGIREAESGRYDLVLLDVMLPGADGFEVCRTIRRKVDIPIIFVSAKKEELDKIRALGLGADDYMIKPFSPGEMVARVKAHLARYDRLRGDPSGEPPNEINVRGLKIDRAAHRVFVNGKEIAVTAKEFDLLSFLADRPNRVFSKEHLFERLWGLDAAGDLSTVTVHVRKLREKIEADPANPQYIETVWGAGYRFTV